MNGAEPPAERRGGGLLRLDLGAVIAVGAAAVVYVMLASSIKPGAGQGLERFARGGMEKLSVPENPGRAPAVQIRDAAGGSVRVSELPGELVVVNLWATWCAPCVKEMPEFKTAAEEFGDAVTFLGVDVEDAPPNAEPFVKRLGIDYPLAIDPRRELYRSVGNFGMPTTLFVDPDGMVQYRHTGPLDAEELRALAAEHLDVRSEGRSSP